MKIIFDNDATVTDYESFIDKYAIPYFQKKYNLNVIDNTALEIKDIFGLNEKYDNDSVNKMLNSFWVSFRFVRYTLLSRFRPGAANVIKKFKRQQHEIEVHTSRDKTCNTGIIGIIARWFTIFQYWLNGVYLSPKKFHFYKDDDEKLKGIINSNPILVFEDKPYLIEQLSKWHVNVLCMSGRHNQDIKAIPYVKCIKSFEIEHVQENMKQLLGQSFLDCCNRGAKSDYYYKKILFMSGVVRFIFQPIVINQKKLLNTNKAVIYVSNHRSTLDPIIITAVIKECIHWAALKRFFLAQDSIFNNSKNPVLCCLTAYFFKLLEFFPIERKRDNPNANNIVSIRDMTRFLKIGHRVGIFPEGTINRPENEEFGIFDPSFIALAENTGAYIQPVTVFWIKKYGRKRIVINFGDPFLTQHVKKEEILRKIYDIQEKMLKENKNYLKD